MFHVYHLHRSSATHNIKLYINSAKIQVHLSTYRKSVFSHTYFRNFEWTRVKRWFPLRIMSDYCKEIQETVMERTYKASSHLINCLILVEMLQVLKLWDTMPSYKYKSKASYKFHVVSFSPLFYLCKIPEILVNVNI